MVSEKSGRLRQNVVRFGRASALAAALALMVSALSPAARAQGEAPIVPTPCDFATSGGFVITDSGKKANFGAHGGCKNGDFWGHLNFMDHTTGYHIDSVQITGYGTPFLGSNIRDICGLATTNRDEPQPVFFHVRVIDNGQPGLSDEFGIRLSNDYVVSMRALNNSRPGGGDVEIHQPNPSTTPPNPLPDESTMCNGVAAPFAGGSPD